MEILRLLSIGHAHVNLIVQLIIQLSNCSKGLRHKQIKLEHAPNKITINNEVREITEEMSSVLLS